MIAKKWLTIITFIFTIIAGALIFLLFNPDKNSIVYDLSLATFGSALLGFTMSLAEYFVERKRAMEYFWQEAELILDEYKKLKPIILKEPEDLLLDCFLEEEKNKLADYFVNNTRNSIKAGEQYDSRSRLISWIKDNEPDMVNDDEESNSILNEVYVKRMQSEREIFENAIREYIKFSEVNLKNLDNAYGNLDFIFGNKKIRQEAYDNIFNRMRSIRNLVLSQVVHFQMYTDGEGSFVVCAKKILELNEKLFTSKHEKYDDFFVLSIYQQEFNEIDDELENFRTKIYFNEKKETKEYRPVTSIITPIYENV